MDNQLKEAIFEALEKVLDGMTRCDLELGDGSIIKAYKMGDLIRIDLKIVEDTPF